MSAIAVIWVVAVLLAFVQRTKHPKRIGYVERTARGMAPMEPPKPWQRINRWAAQYSQTTVEQRIEPGAWPFVASAVHGLPRKQMTDPQELIR